jgi:hypothetical protein
MLEMPSWSGSIFSGGEPQRYPFRVGSKWRREIIGGKYAEVVNKKKITVIFQIKLNAKTPEEQILMIAKAKYTTTPPLVYLNLMKGNINRVRDKTGISKIS